MIKDSSALQKKLRSKGIKPKTKKKLARTLASRMWESNDDGVVQRMDLGGFAWGDTMKSSTVGGLGMVGGMAGGLIEQIDGADGNTSIGGQALGGAAKGAAAGLAFGPLGAAIGGGIGAIGGAIKGGIANRQEREAEEAALKAKQLGIRNNQVASNANAMSQYAPTFAKGGVVPEGTPTLNRTITSDKNVLVDPNQTYTFFNPSDIANITKRDGTYQDWKNNVNGSLAGSPQVRGNHFEVRMKDGSFRYIPEKEINQYVPGDYSKSRLFSKGGMIQQPNVEVEGGEVIDEQGDMGLVKGPSHAQGGVPMNLNPGSRVFSKKLGFADKADELRKQIERYEQILYS